MVDTYDRIHEALEDRYRIERQLGEGGMATVYLAEDLRHRRKVALKVLKPELAAVVGAERFLAEIETTAKLQHPHVLPLFDSGQAAGLVYYVMPFVEGESLRDRLDREEQLPVGEAVHIALGVASALQYAHEQGVIHRDIKPANILLSRGEPLVADFGIALAVSQAGGGRLTETGLSLGTPHYMSPEQATGERKLDRRSDIYALGCVLYEMLAGTPPHQGPNAQAVLAQILTAEPRRLTQLRRTVTAHVDAAVSRALEKLPADRFASAQEFAQALQGRGEAVSTPAASVGSSRSFWARFAAATLFVVGAVFGALVVWGLPSAQATTSGATQPIRATIPLPAGATLAIGSDIPTVGYNSPAVALSPDGGWLAYVASEAAGTAIYLRDMATAEIRLLPGTEGAIHAFFSPDGEWVGFLTANQVKKVRRDGGTVITLCEANTPVLAWWPDPDVIYFSEREIRFLSRVSAEGGMPDSVLTIADVGITRGFSDVLPGGKWALASTGGGINGDYNDVVLVDLQTRATTVLIRRGYGGRYIPPSYLVFARAGALMGARFDPARGTVESEATAIATGIAMESLFGVLHATASGTGVMAFAPGGDLSGGEIAWVDRNGGVEYVGVPRRTYGVLDLAPQDGLLAVHVGDVQDHIWVWDFERREGRQIANADPEGWPLWSPDGTKLAGASFRSGVTATTLVFHDVDAGGQVGTGTTAPEAHGWPTSWSSNSDAIALLDVGSLSGAFVRSDGTRLEAPMVNRQSAFSPDGRWIAHLSSVGANTELVLRSYADARVVGQLSVGGAMEPRWLPSGELFFRNGNRWFSTHVSTTPEPRWDPPRLVFETEFIDTPGLSYDVSSDGQRLLVVKRANPVERSRIEILTNWFELLERPR